MQVPPTTEQQIVLDAVKTTKQSLVRAPLTAAVKPQCRLN